MYRLDSKVETKTNVESEEPGQPMYFRREARRRQTRCFLKTLARRGRETTHSTGRGAGWLARRLVRRAGGAAWAGCSASGIVYGGQRRGNAAACSGQSRRVGAAPLETGPPFFRRRSKQKYWTGQSASAKTTLRDCSALHATLAGSWCVPRLCNPSGEAQLLLHSSIGCSIIHYAL